MGYDCCSSKRGHNSDTPTNGMPSLRSMSERQTHSIRQLTKDGWTLIPSIAFADLLEFCEELGSRQHVKRLIARSEAEAPVHRFLQTMASDASPRTRMALKR